jgi:hypothetical protein
MTLETVLGIIGTVIGVIGLIAAYYFYRKSIKGKEPCWMIFSNNLISGVESKFDGINVIYKGQKVKNVTVSKVYFWNKGSDTIVAEDIQTRNPLVIESLGGAKILEAKILSANSMSTQFKVTLLREKYKCKMHFNYLDKNQGAVIQIIHTGKSSESLRVVGDIRGVTKITNGNSSSRFSRIPLALALLLFFVSLTISAFSILENNPVFRIVRIGGLLYLAVFIAVDTINQLRNVKRHMPKGLEIIQDSGAES